MKSILALLLAAFVLSSLPSCTSSRINTSNPVVQSALTDAEQIAANELSALLDQRIRTRHLVSRDPLDVTIADPVTVGAIEAAEIKIRRKHPEISKAKAHTIAVRAAKAKIKPKEKT